MYVKVVPALATVLLPNSATTTASFFILGVCNTYNLVLDI